MKTIIGLGQAGCSIAERFKKHPQYKNDLGGQYINSIWGSLIFNPIIRSIVKLLGLLIENYWLTRYLIVDSVMRGARRSL